MKTKIKICGIKTSGEARFCLTAGADYLGFNFAATSSRVIDPAEAKEIIRRLPASRVETVGVFQNEKADNVRQIALSLRLDLVQLHGNESVDYCRKLSGLRIIKFFPIENVDVDFPTEFLMFDRLIQGRGETVDFQKVASLNLKKPFFLAGGLSADNVQQAVRAVKPFAVDVASGVETNDRKDKQKIVQFINSVHKAV